MGRWNPLPTWAVALAVAVPTVVCPSIIFSVMKRLYGGGPRTHPITWGLTALYLTFMYLDRKTPSRNPRTSTWARNVWIWRNGRKFFNASFQKNVTVRKDRTYLFGMHPHGVFCFSVWVNFLTNKNAFPELRHTRLATISNNFTTPILRDIMMSLGFIPATKEALTVTLKHDQSTALIIGGASEAAINAEKAVRLILHTRLGFVRVSLEADSPTIVIIHLNENKCFHTPLAQTAEDARDDKKKGSGLSDKLKGALLGFQDWFLKMSTFAIPVFIGRLGSPFLPHPIPLKTVTGEYPIDFRILTEFYYFLEQNGLPLGITPQCPLGVMKVKHKHADGSLDSCYCTMYSLNDIAAYEPQSTPSTQEDQQQREESSAMVITQPLLNRPTPLTRAQITSDVNFPIEYQLQQAEVGDYDEILSHLPSSRKKKSLLKQLAKYKKQNQAKLIAFSKNRKKNIKNNNNNNNEALDSSTTTSLESLPTTTTTTTELTTESTELTEQLINDPYETINKPCFLEEIVYIPQLNYSQKKSILDTIFAEITSSSSPIQQNTSTLVQSSITTDIDSLKQSIPTTPLTINWTQIPDHIVKWLLKFYIAQLQQTYHRFKNTKDVPMELADFDFIKFCQQDCGIYDLDDIPLDIRSRYRFGVDIDDYLILYGFDRGLIMSLLAVFLRLRQPPTPLSLDGKSGRPFKNQKKLVEAKL